jgi:integrase
VKQLATDANTKPFSREEMHAVIQQAEQPMDRGMLLFLRYSGLRILDAITCPMGNIYDGNKLIIRQRKVRHGRSALVSVELPELVVEALRQFKPKSAQHWFWDGRQSEKDVRQWWYKRLKKIFVAAGVPEGHPHSLRHTFAVENILAGMSIKNVSEALGHSSVITTERHYLYWVKMRQMRLEEELRKAHAEDPLLRSLAGTPSKVGTIQVQKGTRRIASA